MSQGALGRGNRLETCGDALELLSAFGIADAAPRPLTGEAENDRAARAVQARAAWLKGKERQDLSAERGDRDPAALEALFGDGFRALPRFGHELSRAPAATGAGRSAVDAWLDGVTSVRDGVAPLPSIGMSCSCPWATSRSAGRPCLLIRPIRSPSPPDELRSSRPAWCRAGGRAIGRRRSGSTPGSKPCPREPRAPPSPSTSTPRTPARRKRRCLRLRRHRACFGPWSSLGDVLRETVDLSEVRLVDGHLPPLYGHLLPALFLARSVGGVPGGDTVATSYEA